MTTPTSMGNHGGTVTSCSPYAYPGFAEIRILYRIWSTVALGSYELAFLINKKKRITNRPKNTDDAKTRKQGLITAGEIAKAMELDDQVDKVISSLKRKRDLKEDEGCSSHGVAR